MMLISLLLLVNRAILRTAFFVLYAFLKKGRFMRPPPLHGIHFPTFVVLLALGCSALTANGNTRILSFGDNTYGQGDVPPELTNAIAVASGEIHSLALTRDGRVVAWGDNSRLQCNVPPDLTNAIAISATAYHSLALTADGRVRVWGWWEYGVTAVPTDLTNAISVEGGVLFAMAATADGRVVVWGGRENSPVPPDGLLPPALTNALGASGSYGFSPCYAVRDDGKVIRWNDGGTNQVLPGVLTNAVTLAHQAPYAVTADGTVVALTGCTIGPALSNVIGVASPTGTPMAITDNGAVYTLVVCGTNGSSQLEVPPAYAISGGAAANTGGPSHYLILVQDGPSTNPPPTIIQQPQSQVVEHLSDVFFTVGALGFPPLRYQWYYNGTNILAGQTNSILRLRGVRPWDSGEYSVVVQNGSTSSTSAPAALTVLSPAQIKMISKTTPAIVFRDFPGTSYHVEYSGAIDIGWTLFTNIVLTDYPQILSDPSASGQPSRFYKVTRLP